MKIYTRTGDDGSTGLIGGTRISKSDARIDAYGTVDELNAAVGLCAAVADAEMVRRLQPVQNELFVIGSLLATPDGGAPSSISLPNLTDESIGRLEQQIDSADAVLPALRNFVLPGGCELSARLHLARTICRRAERLLVALAAKHPIHPTVIIYMNRLSDWLFVQARLANHTAGVPDVPWTR